MAKKQEPKLPHDPRPNPDLLAAVVLHILVSEGGEGLVAERIAIACLRDPGSVDDAGEIEEALAILLDDGLAKREDGLYSPTRAAIRAAELSF